ncbi:TPA: alpha/beta hydrolase [Candidatus Micrarchaeota archaeon]|nr:alpha/beta hydrolase [Candidatus Micrarchaeota archaeon]
MAEKISFTTQDGLTLKAMHYENEGKPAVVLLPMLGRTKDTWAPFAVELQTNGFDVLAMDPWGHGESEGNLASFSEADYNKMVLDLAAAQAFMNKSKISFIGASIGANNALKYASQNPAKVNAIVLLSPGLNYRGVDVSSVVFKGPMLAAASSEDSYSFSSCKTIAENNKAQFLQHSGLGHGTAMLSSKELRLAIIGFLG